MKLCDFDELIGPAPDTSFSGLSCDSRSVAAGDIFFALSGDKTDGSRFIGQAIEKGAAAIITDNGVEAGSVSVPCIAVDDPRYVLAMMAARVHAPQPETIVAVTGTAGKTSVASFTKQIFDYAGFKAASLGTTGVDAPSFTVEGSLTTPDPIALHQMLARLSASGVTHMAMEASSHGIEQRRLDGVELTAAAFTNLGRDHLDYHADMDEYFTAKMRLFDTLLSEGKPAIVYGDDAYSDRAIEVARNAGRDVRSVGRKGDFIALKRVEHERHKQTAEVSHDGRTYRIELPLAGDFQIANALVSAALAISAGVEAASAFAALERLKGASGRLELVGTKENGALVYVDYAHKPDALEHVVKSVRPFTSGRVVVVFGCGGDRDAGKRPIMGKIASDLADMTYVTDDNPRSEEPAQIRSEIMAAAPGAREIGDRREAIFEAVAQLKEGDTLIIAGKGHESGQTANGVTVPFSDHEEARNALAAAGSNSR
ncbi:MAG: UDP-N-acetylmuramoyl-L-alanyl-D-glutamate--2,6-diaminopimelate ligase [Pseudomonadota bacterium]